MTKEQGMEGIDAAVMSFDACRLEGFAMAVEAEVVDPVKLADQLRAMAARIREAVEEGAGNRSGER